MNFWKVAWVRIFKDWFLILEFDTLKLRTWPIFIRYMSSVIEPKYHSFKIVTVDESLHYRISGRSYFSLNKIPVALNISLKLIWMILCILHDRERCIWIIIDSKMFKESEFISLMQLLYEVLFEFKNLISVPILIFSFLFDTFLFKYSCLFLCINHYCVTLIVKKDSFRKVYFPLFFKDLRS